MIPPVKELPAGKKIFFASDFHLGVPGAESSAERERRIVRWLDSIKGEAHSLYLLGDIFDFWFEYAHAIPKGFIRLQGKLAEFTDSGIPVYLFTGNHDMWMFDYFTKELNIPIYREPQYLEAGNKKFLIGHGDGLGPKDHTYKLLKRVFRNRLCQLLFGFIHPNIGIGMANYFSRKSRLAKAGTEDEFLGDDEWLLIYCKETEAKEHHDFYIFGHRHLPLDVPVTEKSRYINLGEWVNYTTYAVFDGNKLELKEFEKRGK